MSEAEAKKEFTKGEFEPLPDGDYLVRMNRCNLGPCNNGQMIKAGFEVATGDYKGRLVFDNFLVEHTSDKAEEIGRKRVSEYLEAVGVEGGLSGIGEDFTKVETYIESPFIATLKTEGERQYQDKVTGETKTAKASNKIKYFKKR